MTLRIAAAALITVLALPGLASATPDGAGGTWAIKGKVNVFAFTLTCKFDQAGEHLTGTCYDGGSNKAHPLTAGSAVGGHVEWTYMSTYLMHPFAVTYSGSLQDGAMKGSVAAPGYTGAFTATRP